MNAGKPPAKSLFERTSGVVDRVAKIFVNLCKIKKARQETIAVSSTVSALPCASKVLREA
jgi:hypothetical protein